MRVRRKASVGGPDPDALDVSRPGMVDTRRRAAPWLKLSLLIVAAFAMATLLFQSFDLSGLVHRTAGLQRDVQNAMAVSLRAVRSGNPAALAGLCALTFAYGFLHAVGPGHGKILLGATAASCNASLRQMSVLTLASNLGQALVAVVAVGIGMMAFDTTSRSLTAAAEQLLVPVSYIAIALVGGVLATGGLRAAWLAISPDRSNGPRCKSDHPPSCACGQTPILTRIDGLTTRREMVWIVASIAIRPCTGALFLLLISWRLEIFPAGVLAVILMGLGTAAFNLLVSTSGVGLRVLTSVAIGRGRFAALISPLARMTAGLLVVSVSLASLVHLL